MKKNYILPFIMYCCLVSVGAQSPVSDPDNAGQWQLNTDLSDEFDGSELDKTKWWILGEGGDYRSKWKGRAPGQFAPQNVAVKDGDLILYSKWEPEWDGFSDELHEGNKYENITQACVMSERFFKYGYMEVRCKIADAPVTCAFWTTGYHSEIDMTENYGKRPIGNPENKPLSLERKFRTNVISWDPKRASDHKQWKSDNYGYGDMDVRLASDYFVYGFEWDKDYFKIYFEGEKVWEATRQELEANKQWVIEHPMELWLDSEVFSWYGLPTAQDLASPAEYKIDYVRIFQKEISGPYFDAYGFEGPFYYGGRSANWWASGHSAWSISTDRSYDGDCSLAFNQTTALTAAQTMYAPFASSNLPAGNNTVSCRLWVDDECQIKSLDLRLQNPGKKIATIDLTSLARNEWVAVSIPFSRDASILDYGVPNANSNPDRLYLQVSVDDIVGTNNQFYVDDIRFEHDNVNRVEAPLSNDAEEPIVSDNLLDDDFFSFEGSIDVGHADGPQSWWILSPSDECFSIVNENIDDANHVLKFSHTSGLTQNVTTFAPYNSLALPSGEMQFSMKVWIEPNSSLKQLRVIFENPWLDAPVINLEGVTTGQWVECSTSFLRHAPSGDKDRIRLQVRPEDIAGTSSTVYFDDIRITKSAALTCLPAQASSLTIYPNPSSDLMHVDVEALREVELYNAQGQLVLKTQEDVLSVSQLDAGVHFAIVSTADASFTQKVFVE